MSDPPEPLDLTDPPSPVLVVVAHPDDIDFGMAGTVARLTEAGAEVVYCLATSGEAGPPEEADRESVAALRVSEQQAAAAAVGVHDVRFLGFPDGHLVADLTLRREISRQIRLVRPAVVIAQSPERSWDSVYRSHPDHLAVGEATMAAVYPDSRNPHAHPDLAHAGFGPHTVPEAWVVGLSPADVFIDVEPVFDRKVAALEAHASQVAWIEDIEGFLRGWSAQTGERLGFPEGRLIEAFRRIRAI